jgi:hypothetical protein
MTHTPWDTPCDARCAPERAGSELATGRRIVNRAFWGRSATITVLAIGASSCAQPLMHVPDELAVKADVYPVHGRTGLLLFGPQISFGPYRTVSIHRGVSVGERSSTATGVLSSEEHDSDRQQFDFELQGPASGAWRVRCVASSDRRSETHVVGVHAGTRGTGLDREQAPISAESGYVCELDGPAAEHWTLQADENLRDGTVLDAAGETIVEIQASDEKATGEHPPLEGNLLANAKNGQVWAVVQRSFDGAVVLSRDLDPKRQTALAAICTALLIPGH